MINLLLSFSRIWLAVTIITVAYDNDHNMWTPVTLQINIAEIFHR